MSSKIVKELISSNKLMIFSKSYCPYCIKVKSLFTNLGVINNAKIIELDLVENGSELQNEMAKICGRSSVPQVFIGSKHVGGSDDVHALHKRNELVPQLKIALNIQNL